jgi:myo-inositol-1(or 4)-monophosphatase
MLNLDPSAKSNLATDSKALRDIARDAALKVAPPLLAAFRSRMTIDYKVDLHDPVTESDRQSEATIREHILGAVPNSVIIGEEGGTAGTGDIQWYVGPIDGTSNFACGLAFWCVSIGAVIGDEMVAGVVYDPVADQMFSADLTGAWLGDEPLRSVAQPDEARATLITGYPVMRDFRLDGREVALADLGELIQAFSTLRRPGSGALSLCHVAAGWVDASAGFGANPWDIAAGALIVRQAGGEYRPLTLGKVAPNTPAHLCPGYVAVAGGGHYPTLDRVTAEISARRERRSAGR